MFLLRARRQTLLLILSEFEQRSFTEANLNYYHKELHLGCCSSLRSASALLGQKRYTNSSSYTNDNDKALDTYQLKQNLLKQC